MRKISLKLPREIHRALRFAALDAGEPLTEFMRRVLMRELGVGKKVKIEKVLLKNVDFQDCVRPSLFLLLAEEAALKARADKDEKSAPSWAAEAITEACIR